MNELHIMVVRTAGAGMRVVGRSRLPALVLGLLLLAGAPAEGAAEGFSYCVTIQITGGPATGNTRLPRMMPPVTGLYVSPTGVSPVAPHTCVYVRLGKPKRGYYMPTIVVWSDVPPPISYHANIYSDPEGIFGFRQQQPSDFTPTGIRERNREMEAYLEAAAGEPVLRVVLRALREGKEMAGFARTLPVPVPGGGGMTVAMPVHYRLSVIRAGIDFPPKIQRLIELGRKRRTPHSPHWHPIRIPQSWFPGRG